MKVANKDKFEKIVFFIVSMVILFLIITWALAAKDSNSPYIRFPNKINTFK